MSGHRGTRRIAIAVPARDEARWIGSCLEGLASLQPGCFRLEFIVLANNCTDDTAGRAFGMRSRLGAPLHVLPVELPPGRANAGWARRLAMDAAAARLGHPDDLILSTDADTLVAADWVRRTVFHIETGYEAVAGLARLDPAELRRLPPAHRLRLAHLRRYEKALDFLRSGQSDDEPWPRHFYEGGASMAVTLRAYRAIGGAPTPAVGEDKALFDAVRRSGGRVRHPLDVRVRTSARLEGRAPGGASDTLALWGRQSEDEPIAALPGFAPNSSLAADQALTFRTLPEEITRLRALVRSIRELPGLARAS